MAITYPHTAFHLYDNSQITPINDVTISKPNYLIAFSADKGPEDITMNTLENFHKRYGDNISFARHGQPLLQAAVAIDNGGIVYCKRVVADDAKLANIAVFATVTEGAEETKTDSKGRKLYKYNKDQSEVTEDQKTALIAASAEDDSSITEANFTEIKVKPALIKYETESYDNCKSMDDVVKQVVDLKTETKFPLFIITDIGRGKSAKSISITPEYNTSKNRGYMRYKLNTIEGSEVVESINVCLNHNVLENSINRSIYTACKKDSYNLAGYNFYDNYDAFIAKVAELSGNTQYYCNSNDILYGQTTGEKKLNNIKIDSTSANLSAVYGISLEHGDNGAFGDAPFGTEAYNKKVTAFFKGEIDEEIYDLDNYKFDLFLDANYAPETKRAMEALAIFREDCQALVDSGIEGLTTLDEIEASVDNVTKSKYVMHYPIYYDVIDPYSGRQITVTAMYSMAKLMIPHFAKSARFKPMAGALNGFTITDAVEGTRNFVPKNLPSGDQREELSELRINHLGEYNHELSFESLWTTQEEYTQLSFGNNMLAIEEVIKAIRDFCPANRFSMMYANDLQSYKDDVSDIIDKYRNNFESIEMTYLDDKDYSANKIFAAAISVACKEFNIAEDFSIYVL